MMLKVNDNMKEYMKEDMKEDMAEDSNTGRGLHDILPFELIKHILSFLCHDLHGMMQCIQVCRLWYQILNENWFWSKVYCAYWPHYSNFPSLPIPKSGSVNEFETWKKIFQSRYKLQKILKKQIDEELDQTWADDIKKKLEIANRVQNGELFFCSESFFLHLTHFILLSGVIS